jgi:hypothetical protein
LVIANASSAPGNSYRVVVYSLGGTATSSIVTLTVQPAIGNYTYPQAITNLNPVAYYRLSEAAGSLYAWDYWGGLTGEYGGYYNNNNSWVLAVTAGVPGVNNTMNSRPIDFPGAPGAFEANNTAAAFTNAQVQTQVNSGTAVNSEIFIPPLTTISNGIITNNMSILMWIYPYELQALTNGLLYCRAGGTTAGFGFADATGGFLGYNWANAAGTYNWITGNSGLIPQANAWNFVALVITPTNGTVYCYNLTSQQSAVNPVANIAQAWGGEAVIGDDPYDITGARQFDGAIDEVAIFNQALNNGQINTLFKTATGIAVPAQITGPLVGQNNFVNLGSTLTYTVNAVNGPTLYYQWVLSNSVYHSSIILTNGNDGISGSLFSGVTNATLTISNFSSSFAAGDILIANVTNNLSTLVATTNTALPLLFPTTATWTADFCLTNNGGWNGGPVTPMYTNYGVVGQGTQWNAINGATFTSTHAGTLTNNSAWSDNGVVTNTGVKLIVTELNVYSSPTPWDSSLLDPFLVMPTSAGDDAVIVSNLVPGYYNLFIYSLNGSWGWRGTTWTINTNNLSANNGTVQTIDSSYLINQNFVVFTNILTLSGMFNISCTPSTTAYLGGGNTANESDFNGMQIQLIQPITPISFTQTGSSVTLTWSGGLLSSSTNVGGTFTPVVANGQYVTSPYTVPAQPSSSAIFYISSVTNTGAPGIPFILGN